ncbi:MAG: hypothetical protein RXO76_08760, partial [Vulcanisaeta sp.]
NRCREAIMRREDKFLSVITRNFAREIYWLHGKFLDWSEVSCSNRLTRITSTCLHSMKALLGGLSR